MEVNRMKNVPYALAVGSIMYAVRCTRLVVAFAQNITSQFQKNPGKLHWTAVKNILKYIRNTKDMFFGFGGNPKHSLRVECIAILDLRLIELTGIVSDRICEAVGVCWLSARTEVAGRSGIGRAPGKVPSAVHYANEPGVQRGARYYLRKYHYVRESVALGKIKILKVHTDNNLVIFYKGFINWEAYSTLLGAEAPAC
ncbi:hypothetical protein Tco_0609566 [Tanacetum coccineum]